MADPKDKTGAAGTKPTGKSAAVKPPVLEGTARPAESAKPASQTASPETKPAEPAKPLPPKDEPISAPEKPAEPAVAASAAPARASSPATWLAGITGGLIGLGGAYGLAVLGLWPTPPVAPPPADPRIASISSAVPELETITSTLQDELATLTARVASFEEAPAAGPGAEAPDPEARAETNKLSADIAALGARIDELAAAPQAAQSRADENAAAIAALEANLAELRQATSDTRAKIDTVSTQVATMSTDISEGVAADTQVLRMPLVISGLQAAFSTGTAYDAEIAVVRQLMPELTIPEPVLANAMTGLSRPDIVARAFNAVLPDILAGRPISANGDWQETTSDWIRGIMALRPTEAVEGDGPESIVARLEAAIGRGDFVAAKTELDSLPPPMRAAAGSVAGEIEAQAAAQNFLATLRQTALAQGNGA